MLDRFINWVSGLGHWAYLLIFLAVCLESAAFLGFLIPGEALVLLGGFLASQGILRLTDLMILIPVAAIVGDSIGYELGRHLGRGCLLRMGQWVGFHEEHLWQVDEFFARHGGKTIFLARFSAFFRILVPFVAGAARLRYAYFLAYNVLGGVIWSQVVVLLGYMAGASWSAIHHWLGRAGQITAAIVVLVLVWFWFRRRPLRPGRNSARS